MCSEVGSFQILDFRSFRGFFLQKFGENYKYSVIYDFFSESLLDCSEK